MHNSNGIDIIQQTTQLRLSLSHSFHPSYIQHIDRDSTVGLYDVVTSLPVELRQETGIDIRRNKTSTWTWHSPVKNQKINSLDFPGM